MDDDRRSFLKKTGVCVVGFGCAGTATAAFARVAGDERPADEPGQKQWAMVVDIRRCADQGDCRACSEACHVAHNVPDLADHRHEVKWIWKEEYRHAFPMQAHERMPASLLEQPTIVLCNHCVRPPCERVCPTQATWRRESDGIVMMDMHRCIGCRYCVVACPYGSRSFNWQDPRPHISEIRPDFPTRMRGVVEKCNFCAERIARGLAPACVEACGRGGAGALTFGDLGDPGSPVSRLLRDRPSIRRKPSLGTQPQVYYLV